MNINFLDCWVFGGPAIIAFGFSNPTSWELLKERLGFILVLVLCDAHFPKQLVGFHFFGLWKIILQRRALRLIY